MMIFLRFLAMLWLMYLVSRVLRSLRDNIKAPPRGPGPFGAGNGRPGPGPFWASGGQGSPFDDYGPFGRFGPFGPNGPFAQGQRPPGAAGYRAEEGPARPGPQTAPAQKTPWEVLGLAPGAPAAEVRRAYQELVRQYHPDRLDGLGVELRALAEQRTKEINAAYNQLKRLG